MLLGFSKLLGTLSCVEIHCMYQTYLGYIIKKKDQIRTYLMMIMRFSFLIFIIKAYVVGTHLNCIDKVDAIQMSNHNICLFKEVDKNYSGCNLNTTKLLDCVLIGICAVIRSNMVYIMGTSVCTSYRYAPLPLSTCTHTP